MNSPEAPIFLPNNELDTFRAEGDLNLSPQRRVWSDEHIGAQARALLEEDA